MKKPAKFLAASLAFTLLIMGALLASQTTSSASASAAKTGFILEPSSSLLRGSAAIPSIAPNSKRLKSRSPRHINMNHMRQKRVESPLIELDPPALGRLASIKAPTLAVVGDLDMPDILDIVERLSREVPGARKVVIPGVAHTVNLEKPAEFNRIVLDFLAPYAKRPNL